MKKTQYQPDGYDLHRVRTQQILDEKFKQGDIKNIYIGEILEGLSEIKSFDERVKALRSNSNRSLNTFLLYAFSDFDYEITEKEINSIDYDIFEEDIALAPSDIFDEAKRFYVFKRTDLKPEAKLKVLGDMFSRIHPSEVELIKGMLTGKLAVKNITKNLVSTAFPDLFPEEEETPEPDVPVTPEPVTSVTAPVKKKAPAKPATKATGVKKTTPKKPVVKDTK